MKALRIIGINLLVLSVLVVVLELTLGSWLKKKHPLSQFNIPFAKTVQFDPNPLYNNNDSLVYYTRDANGLRGTCFSGPETIDLITIGGSTTDQRYITDTATWQEVLSREWEGNGLSYCIANAGVDGHSTFGHIKCMDEWLMHVEELRPKYILFFVGLNDMYLDGETNDDGRFRKQSVNLWQQNSVIYRVLRRVLRPKPSRKNELGHGGADLESLTYTKEGQLTDEQLLELIADKVDAYKGRIERLIAQTQEMGAKAVFVSQPSFRFNVSDSLGVQGVDLTEEKWGRKFNGMDFYKMLSQMNEAMKTVAQEQDALYLNMTDRSIWNKDDFYDFMHMTPQGAKKLGKAIAKEWTPNTVKENTGSTN